MNKLRSTIVFFILMAIGSATIFFSSCSEKSLDGAIIITRSTGKTDNLNYDNEDSWRYVSQTQIAAIFPGKQEASLKILSGDFYSARSPMISYDGKYLLFAAQQKQGDPWQIWEMNLADLKTRRVTSSKENCTDPSYLPGGRLVFSKFTANDSLKAGHSLFTCSLDGTNLKRITFNPHTYFASNILRDGRILTISRQVFPELADPAFMILRPDGTKSELFFKDKKETYITSPGFETLDGRILFIQSDKASSGKGSLLSISYNRPLHSMVNLSSQIEGDFHAACPLRSGGLLVSYRKSASDRYALYEFDQESKTLGKALYNNAEYDVLEAVESGKHERPKKLPSEVDMGVKTGLLLSQDINVKEIQTPVISSSTHRLSRIEIVGIDSTLGIVQVEEDGSFYLKVVADKPFKIQTIDKDGHVSGSPCGWIWLRPNERRGCVGCHEDPEMIPENRVSLAVKKSPVNIPMHITKVVEKKVSLE